MLTEEEQEEYRARAVEFLLAVWSHINWDNVGPSRRMRIYDELSSKIKSAAMTNNLDHFLEKFMTKWGVRSISDFGVLDILRNSNHRELLNILRNDTALIILMLRDFQDNKKNVSAGKIKFVVGDDKQESLIGLNYLNEG